MSPIKIPLIVLLGPTASGKTEIAVKLSKELNTPVISADSRQVYKYMNIGTDKPTEDEQKQTSYHLIDLVSPDENFTAAGYKKEAEKLILKLIKQDKVPFLVGGTGLYIRAVIDGLFPGPEPDYSFRENLEKEAKEKGPAYLHNRLQKVDPVIAKKLHQNDTFRIIRALEVFESTGLPISRLQAERTQKNDYDLLMIGLRRDRKELYGRIEKRVDKMIESGLVNEVENLLEKGYNKNLVSMQGLGYKQIIGYLEKKYSMEHAINLLKRDTRRFAKRQMTWFRKDQRISWFDLPRADIIDKIMDLIKKAFFCLTFLFIFSSIVSAEKIKLGKEYRNIISLSENGFLDEAKEETEKTFNVNDPERFILLGRIYLKGKIYSEAKKSFLTALKLLPESKEALINLGEIALLKNNLTELKELKTKLEIISPDDYVIGKWNDILDAYDKKNKYLEEYEKIKSQPEINRAELAAILAVELRPDFLKDKEHPIITDISNHWAKESIKEIINKGIMEIYSNHNFIPEKQVTRAELTYYIQEIMVRLNNKPEIRYIFKDFISPFADLSEDHLYYNPIILAATRGILSGTSPEEFSPESGVSGELAIETIQKFKNYLKDKKMLSP